MIGRYVLFAEGQEFINQMTAAFGSPSLLVSNQKSDKVEARLISDKAYRGEYSLSEADRQPLSNSWLSSMSKCECLALRMMDRTDRCENFYFRQRSYRTHLSYWTSALSQINTVIFENIPHEVYDFIAYEVARALRKKVYCFYFLPVIPPFYLSYIVENIYNHSENIGENGQSLSSYTSSLDTEIEAVISQITSLHDLPIAKRPSFSGKERRIRVNAHGFIIRIKNNLRSLFKDSPKSVAYRFRLRLAYLIDPNRERSLFFRTSSLDSLGIIPPESLDDFIYFPLHFQPELSTAPIGGFFEDQELIVNLLVPFCRRYGKKLLVKVHPRQHPAGLRRSFLNRLSNPAGDFIVVNSSTPSHLLLSRAAGVVTVSGSIGWESLLASKPLMLFGTRLYEILPGVKKVAFERDLEVFFTETLNEPAGRASAQWEAKMKLLRNRLFVGNISSSYVKNNRSLEAISAQNAVRALKTYISLVNSAAKCQQLD